MTPRAFGVGALALVTIAGACRGRERTQTPPPETVQAVAAAKNEDWLGPPPPFYACLAGDSATYSDVRIDTLTGDTTGIALTFWRAGDGIDGAATQSSDPSRTPAPFLRIQLSGEDSIALDMLHPTEPDTIRFLGRISCGRLWGRQRNRRGSVARPALYSRSY